MPKRTGTTTMENASQVKQKTKLESQKDIDLLDDSSRNGIRQRKRRPNSREKSEKGLRSFAIRVRKKVEEKKRTTYNQVADELVKEVLDPTISDPTNRFYDEKNIRRRVYDALNVLMAMGMIEKRKKDILWRGVSFDNSEFLKELEEKVKFKNEELRQKRHRLEELEAQKSAVEAMLRRNASSSVGEFHPESCIHLPFIIVSTSTDTSIDVEMEENAEEVLFTFNRPFEIYDDQVILQGIFRNATFNDHIAEPTNVLVPEKQRFAATHSHHQLNEQMKERTQHSSFSNGPPKNFVDNNSILNSHLVYLTDDV
ncbi:transcription factor Dp, invertebrate [Galdieria sulphuraria]|uniref:Transcription factor Dp, invertebrate n=1 Tax=Galdieria sulphuraria TaxID=130081 RepID=M2Y9D9_GALSU|nr:transcription factor Dp, invertebrate [Galdieria sulphuraria]EME32479.1 transcription factor Dp, invertebrate [Galdieria sulphuraria]|eukprot:XP_005708999.1 transcription factor Dp, invertebrate [Galdieria sulphuraria]